MKMGPIGCSETSIRNCHYSLCKSPEERSSNPLRCGSLKSRFLCVENAEDSGFFCQVKLGHRRSLLSESQIWIFCVWSQCSGPEDVNYSRLVPFGMARITSRRACGTYMYVRAKDLFYVRIPFQEFHVKPNKLLQWLQNSQYALFPLFYIRRSV
jgi:hypothetical protein